MSAYRNMLAADFLLGRLPEDSRSQFEERFVVDKSIFDELIETENEIIDDYVADRLSADERLRFERSLRQNPTQRQKVAFARALSSYAARLTDTDLQKRSDPISRWFDTLRSMRPLLALTAAIVVLSVVAAIWLSRPETSDLVAEQGNVPEAAIPEAIVPPTSEVPPRPDDTTGKQIEPPQPPPSPKEKPAAEPRRPLAIVSTIILSGGVTRGAGGDLPVLRSSRQGLVRLQIEDSEDYREFSAFAVILETVSGEPVWSGKPVKTSKGFTATIPAKRLSTGDLIVTVKGIRQDGASETLNEYSFSVR